MFFRDLLNVNVSLLVKPTKCMRMIIFVGVSLNDGLCIRVNGKLYSLRINFRIMIEI